MGILGDELLTTKGLSNVQRISSHRQGLHGDGRGHRLGIHQSKIAHHDLLYHLALPVVHTRRVSAKVPGRHLEGSASWKKRSAFHGAMAKSVS